MTRETIVRTVLSNCLQIKFKRSEQRTVNIGLFINHGSKDEDVHKNGLAHYIEHVLYNPAHMAPKTRELYEDLLSVGLSYEAYTSKEFTRMVVTCLPEQVEPALQMLSLLIQRPSVTVEAVEHERPIILHEHAMRFSSSSVLGELLDNAFWGNRSLGLFVIGRKENIQRFTVDEIKERIEAYYIPERVHLVVLGPIDVEPLNRLAERYFGEWNGPTRSFHDVAIVTEPRILSVPTKSPRVDLLIGFLGVPASSEERPAIELLADILGGGLKSRLFVELREKRKLAYLVHAYALSYISGGYLAIKLNCDIAQLADVFRVIQDEIEHIKRDGVTEAELARVKATRKTAILRVLENSHQHILLMGQHSIQNEEFFVDLVINGVESVQVQDVQNAAIRVFNPDNMAVAGFGPQEQDILALI
ncbi:MAG: insulinase family protein [Chloroflexi bacterium]|nr:insulinase family protein [Chloroflexota bacterium]